MLTEADGQVIAVTSREQGWLGRGTGNGTGLALGSMRASVPSQPWVSSSEWLKGHEHGGEHGKKRGTAPGSKVGNFGAWGSREGGTEGKVVTRQSHPCFHTPSEAEPPGHWLAPPLGTVKVSELLHQGLMTGSGQALCI